MHLTLISQIRDQRGDEWGAVLWTASTARAIAQKHKVCRELRAFKIVGTDLFLFLFISVYICVSVSWIDS